MQLCIASGNHFGHILVSHHHFTWGRKGTGMKRKGKEREGKERKGKGMKERKEKEDE